MEPTVFVYLHEGVQQFMVCARIGIRLQRNMMKVLNDDGYKSKYDITYAIFYSVFRLPEANLKVAGTNAIKDLIEHCCTLGIKNFLTPKSDTVDERTFKKSQANQRFVNI